MQYDRQILTCYPRVKLPQDMCSSSLTILTPKSYIKTTKERMIPTNNQFVEILRTKVDRHPVTLARLYSKLACTCTLHWKP